MAVPCEGTALADGDLPPPALGGSVPLQTRPASLGGAEPPWSFPDCRSQLRSWTSSCLQGEDPRPHPPGPVTAVCAWGGRGSGREGQVALGLA